MEVDNLKVGAPVDAPTVSASMATALLAYSGIAVKMLVDQRLGAVLHTMFMVEYQPGGAAAPHDHPFEETYYLLDGEVDATADDEVFTLDRAISSGPASAVSTRSTTAARPCAVPRDTVPATSGQPLLPLQSRLGLPCRPARLDTPTRSHPDDRLARRGDGR